MNSFCNIHQVSMEQRLSKTKFDDNGQPKAYFAHMNDGKMCFGRPEKPSANGFKPAVKSVNSDSMFMCNALNNAVALVTAGVVPVEKLGDAYKRCLAILTEKTEELDKW